MSFSNQKPFEVTEKHVKTRWGGRDNNFRCIFCGYRFKVGDIARWQYTNNTPYTKGNPFVCEKCDGPTDYIIDRMKTMKEEFQEINNKFWWFINIENDMAIYEEEKQQRAYDREREFN